MEGNIDTEQNILDNFGYLLMVDSGFGISLFPFFLVGDWLGLRMKSAIYANQLFLKDLTINLRTTFLKIFGIITFSVT